MTKNLAAKVREFIIIHKLVQKQEPIIVGVSGGVDSIVLAHILHRIGYPIHIAHINYNYRPESGVEEVLVQDFSGQLKVPFHLFRNTPNTQKSKKGNLQNEARQIRYDFFNRLKAQENIETIAVAHHLDDQVETILYNLFNGTGLAGLRGMLSKNDLGVVRPLLPFTREEIVHYAKENELEWREDSSNATNKYVRNRLRNEVLPLIENIFPGYRQNVGRAAKRVLEVTQKNEQTKDHFEAQKENSNELFVLKISDLNSNDSGQLFDRIGNYGFSGEIIGQILRASHSDQNNKVFKNKDYTFLLEKDRGFLTRNDHPFWLAEPTLKLDTEGNLSVYWENWLGIRFEVEEKTLLKEKPHFYQPTKKEKKQLQEVMRIHKIPVFLRSNLPVIKSGEQIIAIGYIGLNDLKNAKIDHFLK
jgi:tRNA(Ile)-lysidine synthase